ADRPVRRATGQSVGAEPGRSRGRQAGRSVPLQAARGVRVDRRTAGGRTGVRTAFLGAAGVVFVARRLLEQDADARPEGANRLRLAVAAFLPPRHRAAESLANGTPQPRPLRGRPV